MRHNMRITVEFNLHFMKKNNKKRLQICRKLQKNKKIKIQIVFKSKILIYQRQTLKNIKYFEI